MSAWTHVDQDRLMSCREAVYQELVNQMRHRHERDDWEMQERASMAMAARLWAYEHGGNSEVFAADIERIEHRAMGHIDYASKIALYVAELVVRPAVSSPGGNSG